MPRARKNRSDAGADRGAAAVEFGLLLPLILLIVLGIIDFGGMLHAQITLTQAAREGARVAALQDPYDYDLIKARTWGAVVSQLVDEEDRFSVDAPENCPDDSADATDDDAVVTANYSFEYITPIGALISAFGGEGFDGVIPLSATGVMPCET